MAVVKEASRQAGRIRWPMTLRRGVGRWHLQSDTGATSSLPLSLPFSFPSLSLRLPPSPFSLSTFRPFSPPIHLYYVYINFLDYLSIYFPTISFYFCFLPLTSRPQNILLFVSICLPASSPLEPSLLHFFLLSDLISIPIFNPFAPSQSLPPLTRPLFQPLNSACSLSSSD